MASYIPKLTRSIWVRNPQVASWVVVVLLHREGSRLVFFIAPTVAAKGWLWRKCNDIRCLLNASQMPYWHESRLKVGRKRNRRGKESGRAEAVKERRTKCNETEKALTFILQLRKTEINDSLITRQFPYNTSALNSPLYLHSHFEWGWFSSTPPWESKQPSQCIYHLHRAMSSHVVKSKFNSINLLLSPCKHTTNLLYVTIWFHVSCFFLNNKNFSTLWTNYHFTVCRHMFSTK